MPDVTVQIGGRKFSVACRDGEESYLNAAAKLLDDEARALSDQIGRVPEARMLLMAGLILADKTAALREKTKGIEARLAECESELARLRNQPKPEPERVEVPVVPDSVTDTLAELAARAEAVAAALQEKTAPVAFPAGDMDI